MLNSRTITDHQLAKTIDHSLLKPEMTVDEVLAGCALAAEYHTASVCARPSDVCRCVEALSGTDVAVGTVIGFPHGSAVTAVKVFEARTAIEDGAVELDMVINIGALRSGLDGDAQRDIEEVVLAAGRAALVKVILETAYLTTDEIVRGCQLAESAGAAYVKTSTGYAPAGATLEHIRLMRASVGPKVKVKAAGGVRTLEALLDMIDAGADRVGATATKSMLDAFAERGIGVERVGTPGP